MLELSKDEIDLVEGIECYLDSHNPEESSLVKRKFGCLKDLGEAISNYPSVRESQKLRGIERNEEQLLEALCSFASSSHLLHIPARVVASKSYLVAKYQAFSMLHILAGEHKEFNHPLRKVILTIIHTLMAEEVYFSCLDDPGFSHKVKLNLANDLISLWDSGTDTRSVRHLMALSSLWTARDSSPPSFGTMDGNTELVRISIDMENADWEEFLKEESTNNNTRWALEEFLFGLSYEEIVQVRARLKRYGVTSVSHDELRNYLDSMPVYSVVNDHNPRAIYDFFIERRDACSLRKRISATGPLHTIEEIYLKYRIILESA